MKTLSEWKKQQSGVIKEELNFPNYVMQGLTNKYTPVENIVMNVKNLFVNSPIVVSVAEDGVSIKITSSEFFEKSRIDKVLYTPMYQNTSVYSYIASQGLTDVKLVNLGQWFVVYIGPKDIKGAITKEISPDAEAIPGECDCPTCPCKEMQLYGIEEAEIIKEAEDEEEIEKLTKKQINEIIDAKDKVKAAKQFGIIVAQQISLPQEYYFAGVKDKDGEESIALRWKYIKRRPHGKSTEVTRSLMNIFGTGDYAVWVGDFDKKVNFELPADVKKLIESILELLGAEKTSDPCVFKIEKDGEKKEDDSKKDDDDKDHEDDDSRGDDSDNNDDNKKEDDKKDDKGGSLL